MRSAILVAPLLMMLSACAGEPTRIGASPKLVEAEEAMLMPPPGSFSVSGITQKRFSNGTQQEIFLSTVSAVPGQNVVQIRLFGTRNDLRYRDDQLRFKTLTDAGVDAEMRGTLPGIAMQRSPYLVQNDYGGFGYAFGRPSATELCMYAWQQLRTPEGEKPPFGGWGAIQIRVRLCETSATERKLLAFMYGYSIVASVDDLRWNPYGTPGPVNDRIGRSGDPIYPPELTAPAAEPAPETPAAAPRRIRPRVQAQPPVAMQPAFGAGSQIVVPSPVATVPQGAAQPLSPAPMPAPSMVPSPSGSGTGAGQAPHPSPSTLVPSPACGATAPSASGTCR